MQMKFANRDELAWEKGELAYTPGDTMEAAIRKARDAGFRPGSNGYAAFITAFSRRVRNRNVCREAEDRQEQGIGADAFIASDFETRANILEAKSN